MKPWLATPSLRLSPGVLISQAAHVTSASATMSSALRAWRGRGSEQWVRETEKPSMERERGKSGGGVGMTERGVAASETEWAHHWGAAASAAVRRRTEHPHHLLQGSPFKILNVFHYLEKKKKSVRDTAETHNRWREQVESDWGELGERQTDPSGPRTATMAPMVEEGAQIGESN